MSDVLGQHRKLGTHLLARDRWAMRQLFSPYPIAWTGCGQDDCDSCAKLAADVPLGDTSAAGSQLPGPWPRWAAPVPPFLPTDGTRS